MRFFATLAVAALLFAAALPGQAEESPVHLDWPTTLDVLQLDLSATPDPTDDCFYADTDLSGTISTADVRLTPCMALAAGSLVRGTDTLELGASATQATVRAAYVDQDGDGAFNATDDAYLTTNATVLDAPGNGTFTLRLTPVGAFAAGTLVGASDADALLVAPDLIGAFAVADMDGNGAFGMGDQLYLVPADDVLADGFVPLGSVRLVSAFGAFGSQVDAYTSIVESADSSAPLALLRADGATEACAYAVDLGWNATQPGALRLTACEGFAAGTFVSSGDADDARNGTSDSFAAAFGDLDANGAYGRDEPVWVTLSSFAATNATNTLLRLTAFGAAAAGTFVVDGDDDLNYTAFAVPFGNVSIAYAEGNASVAGPSADDALYLLFQPVGTPAGRIPLLSLRVTDGNANGAFGTQVWLSGDGPATPGAEATSTTSTSATSSTSATNTTTATTTTTTSASNTTSTATSTTNATSATTNTTATSSTTTSSTAAAGAPPASGYVYFPPYSGATPVPASGTSTSSTTVAAAPRASATATTKATATKATTATTTTGHRTTTSRPTTSMPFPFTPGPRLPTGSPPASSTSSTPTEAATGDRARDGTTSATESAPGAALAALVAALACAALARRRLA